MRWLPCLVWLGVFTTSGSASANAEDSAVEKSVKQASQKVIEALNSKKIDEVVSTFLPEGELVDEAGRTHKGQKEIKELLTNFVGKHPNAKAANDIESVSSAGPVVIECGIRTVRSKVADEGDESEASVKYTAVWLNADGKLRLVSLRDATDDSVDEQEGYDDFVSPKEGLMPLEWLIGNWVNEGSDGRVSIQYRWSDDENFILGDFVVNRGGERVMESSVRIGWDGVEQKIRSWIFDSDGGFSESLWTQTPDAWVIQSKAVSPDALAGAATLIVTKVSDNRIQWQGKNRLIGDTLEDDFEITLVRQPPSPEDFSVQVNEGHSDK